MYIYVYICTYTPDIALSLSLSRWLARSPSILWSVRGDAEEERGDVGD